MNKKMLDELVKAEIKNNKAMEENVMKTEEKKYNFNGVRTVNDVSDGCYRAYVIGMTLTKQYATIELYMKPLLTPKAEGIRLAYMIGEGSNAYTKMHTSNIYAQLPHFEADEYKLRLEEFWARYYIELNNYIAAGYSEKDAKLQVMQHFPKWYEQGIYKDLGEIVCKAYHITSKGKKFLKLDFNADKIKGIIAKTANSAQTQKLSKEVRKGKVTKPTYQEEQALEQKAKKQMNKKDTKFKDTQAFKEADKAYHKAIEDGPGC
jgi:hypothetical protein